ncbi:hypothetical protein F5Y18DRAFT_116023 [Xylariaceae sp. FL1019]|nr:hypothetical protein F5Y18DRAFT_116023 [Xylariaceae sp. FL1019]
MPSCLPNRNVLKGMTSRLRPSKRGDKQEKTAEQGDGEASHHQSTNAALPSQHRSGLLPQPGEAAYPDHPHPTPVTSQPSTSTKAAPLPIDPHHTSCGKRKDSQTHSAMIGPPKQSDSEDMEYPLAKKHLHALPITSQKATPAPDSGHAAILTREDPFDIQIPHDGVIEESAMQESLQRFVAKTKKTCCAHCGRGFRLNESTITTLTTQWTSSSPDRKLVLGRKCSSSSKCPITCLGCGRSIPHDESAAFLPVSLARDRVAVYHCCERGRIAALWALACGWKIEKVANSQHNLRSSSSHNSAPEPATAKENKVTALPRGTGYDAHTSIASMFLGRNPPAKKRTMPPALTDEQAQTYEAYYRLITMLLPSPDNWGKGSPTTIVMLDFILSHSPVFDAAVEILSVGSLDEMSRRFYLSRAVLAFVERLGDHPELSKLSENDRKVYSGSAKSLFSLSFGPLHSDLRPIDTGKPVMSLIESLHVQARSFVKLAGPKIEDLTKTGDGMLYLSTIVNTMMDYRTLKKQISQPQQSRAGTSSIPLRIDWHKWHDENSVLEVEDTLILEGHQFSKEASAASKSPPALGRMKRLVTELSTLKTSLPEGIFVRHGDSRLDVMQIMIVGPRGTPYEHGIFEFDLWCPTDYPRVPPKMRFKTTGGGKVSFNPNLYADGKICLSLLGTWSGEPWRPEQSTILQVLLSIQTMIFCENPWYNEPGRETHPNKAQSTRFNQTVAGYTFDLGILPWLSLTPGEHRPAGPPNRLWKDIAVFVLKNRGQEILKAYQGHASTKLPGQFPPEAMQALEMAVTPSTSSRSL